MARVVALTRSFHLHDVGAKIREKLSGPWSCENPGKFEDANALERNCHDENPGTVSGS